MSSGNNFPQPSPSHTTSVMIPTGQQQQQPPVVIASTTPISSLPTLSPATIVRAVFMPPNQQHQQHQFSNNPDNSAYVFPTQQLHRHTQSTENLDSVSASTSSGSFEIQNSASTLRAPINRVQQQQQQQRQKGQPKQPQQPRQPKSTKKPAKQSTSQKGESQQQRPPPKGPGSQHHSTQAGARLTKKQQEKEDYYNRKYQLLRKCIRSLVFKNAALCDEVARLHQRIAVVDSERKIILKRLLHHERLKERRKQAAEVKKAQQQAAAMAAEIASSAAVVSSAVPSPVATCVT